MLEPGIGTGLFPAMLPEALRDASHVTGAAHHFLRMGGSLGGLGARDRVEKQTSCKAEIGFLCRLRDHSKVIIVIIGLFFNSQGLSVKPEGTWG